ncbi:MAG: type II toxin-antitoxin system HipA family toxin, partial [Gammaproteobacteria bacterium]|nr:type II toxin-antitoxin system HipA family toxin [Gammaproteobacteria bacterium]
HLNVSPLQMPVEDALRGDGIYSFPTLNRDTYMGLPGLLADALPDKFGHRIIDAWLARNGIAAADFSPIERLCYTGRRATGALEFAPTLNASIEESTPVEIAELVELAQAVTADRGSLDVSLTTDAGGDREALLDILRVGTSAGGNRPKAVIAMNDDGHVMSGQLDAPPGYEHWILKFDGVDDIELGTPQGYGRIEFAYHLMARDAGIDMTECRLLEENGRAHFMTRRFDRDPEGRVAKLHMQTLCGIAHYDFNQAGEYAYEQAFTVMRRLRLPKSASVQQFRRMVFNAVSRNQDDHTKNIAFLMDPDGNWSLSPAYDLTYSHNPAGRWTNQHQMSINGKRDRFEIADVVRVGESIGIGKPAGVVADVVAVVENWPSYAARAGVPPDRAAAIATTHRLNLRP